MYHIHHIALYYSLQPFFHCCLSVVLSVCSYVPCVRRVCCLDGYVGICNEVRGQIQAASLSSVQQKGS